MHFFHKSSEPDLAHSGSVSTHAGGDPSFSDPEKSSNQQCATEIISPFHRPWARKGATVDLSGSCTPKPMLPSIPVVEILAHNGLIHEMSRQTCLPASTNVSQLQADLASAPVLSAIKGSITKAFHAAKDGSNCTDTSQQPDDGDDATSQNNVPSKLSTAFGAVALIGTSIDEGGLGRALKEKYDDLVDNPYFITILDELKTLHPFIGVAVLAFKAAHSIWTRHRYNEKKISVLYIEMKDMMSVLLHVKDVHHDDKHLTPDGMTIEDRLGSLVERAADDIKNCANVCDTYIKKKVLAKVVLSPFWDDKFVGFVKLFTQRRQEFEHRLVIHTSQGVNKANVKLDAIEDATKALDLKLKLLTEMLHEMVSPEHKRLCELVVEKGGAKAVRDSDKTLREVEKIANDMSSASCAKGHHTRREMPEDPNPNVDDLRSDIFENPDVAVQKNSAKFFRKFEAQMNQFVKDVTIAVEREGDRVVRELRGCSHERIQDPSIREIWKDMGWRGSVKARHFVLALQDHFQNTFSSESEDMLDVGVDVMSSSSNSHAWALQFVNVTRLQPILEAIDDDTTGFITIAEMNRFTSSKPDNWSLPHWVAFWAIGYRSSIIDYANEIEHLFAKMEGIRAEVLPPNRKSIDDYFAHVWEPIHTLTAAVLPLRHVPNDVEIFRSYLEAEEARLSNNLKEIDYIVDGTDTLSHVMGVGRIEKTLFPLLYLLMKRHYEIMRTMRTKILHSRELSDSVKSIFYVQVAIRYRVSDLTDYFFEQKVDIEKKFHSFAYGIFKYFHNGKALWSTDYVWSLNPSPAFIPYNDANEDPNVKPEDILKHEHSEEVALEDWVYDGHSTDDIPKYGDVESPLRDILGHWHGYFYEGDGIRETKGTDTMMTFVLEPADGEQNFKAKAWSIRGPHTITGSWSRGENDILQINFQMSFHDTFWPVFFSGHFDPSRDALTGVWDLSAGRKHTAGPMEFRRLLPRYLTVYPSIKELSDNKPRALWRFAITAVRNDIRRERWSWSYFSQRRDDRETVISLMLRYLHHGTPLNEEETQRMCTVAQRLTSADACFYGSKINHRRAHTWVHANAYCDSCGGLIGGARLFCLECAHKSTEAYVPLNLCCKPECISQRITHRQDLEGEHEPNHNLVKVRTSLLKRQEGRARTAAHAAFRRVEQTCKKIAKLSQEKEKIRRDVENAASWEQPLTEVLPTSGNLYDGQAPLNGIEDGAKDIWDMSDGSEDGISQDAIQVPGLPQTENNDLPTCGKCNGALSFPCWYCIVCEDDLFICDACDASGVHVLTRSSGMHHERHPLIRCLTPEMDDDTTSATEKRLVSIEGRLNDMQTRFDDINDRFDDLSSRIGDLSDRFCNIEQLLHRLVVAVGNST